LVPSQVLQFADLRSDGFQPAKLLFLKEVVQKLKFPNNFNHPVFNRKGFFGGVYEKAGFTLFVGYRWRSITDRVNRKLQ
jgi:hypothetical protein